MSKFMLLYKGPATDPQEMAEADRNAVMAKWKEWMDDVGSALVDVGTPLGQSASVVDDGSSGSATQLNGYSIVEAADLGAATALCENHPFLSDKTGEFAVDVYEMLPVPGM